MPPMYLLATGVEIAIATLMLLFGGFLLFGSGQKTVPAYALASATIIIGFEVLLSTLGSINALQWLRFAKPPLALLFGPALLIYISQIRQGEKRTHPALLVHTIPAVIAILLIVVGGGEYIDTLLNVCIGAYWLACAALFVRHKSDFKPRTIYRFVFWLIAVFGMVYILDAVLSYQAKEIGDYRSFATYLIALLATFIGAARMMWTALRNPRLLASPSSGIKYARSVLDERSARALSNGFDTLVNEEKAFMDPDISLASVASKLGAQSRHVSQLVNTRFKTNFSAYINEQRVREAARRLGSCEKSITEVMYEVGFNSKSTFNREFRRVYGSSPKKWRSREQA